MQRHWGSLGHGSFEQLREVKWRKLGRECHEKGQRETKSTNHTAQDWKTTSRTLLGILSTVRSQGSICNLYIYLNFCT